MAESKKSDTAKAKTSDHGAGVGTILPGEVETNIKETKYITQAQRLERMLQTKAFKALLRMRDHTKPSLVTAAREFAFLASWTRGNLTCHKTMPLPQQLRTYVIPRIQFAMCDEMRDLVPQIVAQSSKLIQLICDYGMYITYDTTSLLGHEVFVPVQYIRMMLPYWAKWAVKMYEDIKFYGFACFGLRESNMNGYNITLPVRLSMHMGEIRVSEDSTQIYWTWLTNTVEDRIRDVYIIVENMPITHYVADSNVAEGAIMLTHNEREAELDSAVMKLKHLYSRYMLHQREEAKLVDNAMKRTLYVQEMKTPAGSVVNAMTGMNTPHLLGSNPMSYITSHGRALEASPAVAIGSSAASQLNRRIERGLPAIQTTRAPPVNPELRGYEATRIVDVPRGKECVNFDDPIISANVDALLHQLEYSIIHIMAYPTYFDHWPMERKLPYQRSGTSTMTDSKTSDFKIESGGASQLAKYNMDMSTILSIIEDIISFGWSYAYSDINTVNLLNVALIKTEIDPTLSVSSEIKKLQYMRTPGAYILFPNVRQPQPTQGKVGLGGQPQMQQEDVDADLYDRYSELHAAGITRIAFKRAKLGRIAHATEIPTKKRKLLENSTPGASAQKDKKPAKEHKEKPKEKETEKEKQPIEKKEEPAHSETKK